MQKCEIMLNDLIGSKRTNTNIKATIAQPSHTGSFLNIYIFSRIGVITLGLYALVLPEDCYIYLTYLTWGGCRCRW